MPPYLGDGFGNKPNKGLLAPHKPTSDPAEVAKQCELSLPLRAASSWSPYVDNGGTCMALGGKGYVIVAADTRLSLSLSLKSRGVTKTCALTESCVLASSGMQADRVALHKNLLAKIQLYSYQNNGKIPGVKALSQLLSTTLYYRRFFPYYTFNLLGGLDENGDGVVYGYDAIGCTEPLPYGVSGSGTSMALPLLDNQLLREHQKLAGGPAELTLAEALELIKEAFTSVGERDIYTGDSVEIYIITKEEGLKKELFALKRD